MIKQSVKKYLKGAMVILILVGLSGICEGYIKLNELGGSFTELEHMIIEDQIIKGAVEFLRSYGEMVQLMATIEGSSAGRFDVERAKLLVDRMIVHMEGALFHYSLLAEKANKAQYNMQVINRLKSLNYGDFGPVSGEDSRGFERANAYLSSGNIRGLCQKNLLDTEEILMLLYSIQMDIETGQCPTRYDLLQINKKYSASLLEGQHVARIFSVVLEKIRVLEY